MEQTRRIKTERLILEPVKIYHTADLFQIFSHPEAMTFWDTPQHESATDTGEMIESFMQPDASWWSISANGPDQVASVGTPGRIQAGLFIAWIEGFHGCAVVATI